MLIHTLLTAANMIGPVQADSLRPYRWEYRPIIVFAEDGDPRLAAQLDLLHAAKAQLIDRDNLIVVDPGGNSALAQRFRPDGFTIILVGLDGGEKFRSTDVVDPRTLNALIDTMPMRQQELRGNSD